MLLTWKSVKNWCWVWMRTVPRHHEDEGASECKRWLHVLDHIGPFVTRVQGQLHRLLSSVDTLHEPSWLVLVLSLVRHASLASRGKYICTRTMRSNICREERMMEDFRNAVHVDTTGRSEVYLIISLHRHSADRRASIQGYMYHPTLYIGYSLLAITRSAAASSRSASVGIDNDNNNTTCACLCYARNLCNGEHNDSRLWWRVAAYMYAWRTCTAGDDDDI